jgi:molybdopterin molybdotransferase
MSNPQRLPTSLTPLDVALSALSALLRELKPVATSERASPDTTGCGAVEISELKAWPPHDVAAVDGWALRVSDLVGASSYSPLLLTTPPVWVESGERIPDGCDCVLDDDCVDRTGPMAQVLAEAIPGQGIRRKGREIADASRVVNAWRTGDLHPAARRPRLRMVNIPGGIITAKLIAASLCEAGIGVDFVEAAARDAASIAKALDTSTCDLLLMIGGSGVGRTDATLTALAGCGEIIAHGLALQPGRTAAIGRIGAVPVIALPGAPDQALAIWWTLVLPVLDRLSGGSRRETITLPLARKIASGVGIAEVALLDEKDGAWMPLVVGDLPLATIARAQAWLLVPDGSEGYAAGTPVDAYMLRERAQ